MFQKIANTLSIISFLMVSSMSVGAFLAIRYMQSPEFEWTLKNKLMGSLENKLPDVMKNTLPDFTGPSIEIPKKQVSPLGNTQNWYTADTNKRDIYSKNKNLGTISNNAGHNR